MRRYAAKVRGNTINNTLNLYYTIGEMPKTIKKAITEIEKYDREDIVSIISVEVKTKPYKHKVRKRK